MKSQLLLPSKLRESILELHTNGSAQNTFISGCLILPVSYPTPRCPDIQIQTTEQAFGPDILEGDSYKQFEAIRQYIQSVSASAK
jgi:hypothetical protein